MSTTTPNLSLTLYDNSTDLSVTFLTFRTAWGGTAITSNFYKIDTAYGLLDDRVTTLEGKAGAIPVFAITNTTNNYISTVADITGYINGMSIILAVDVTSTGTVTLDINSLGVKSVMKVNTSGSVVNLTSGDLRINMEYLFSYDGTRWIWVGATSAGQINISGTAGNIVTINTDNTLTSSSLGSIIDSATAKTSLVDADELALADSAASFVLKKITWANIKATFMTALGALISALTGKTTPVGADVIVVGDSASSYASKSVLLSNLYKALGTGSPSSTTALLGDGSWGSVSGFWNLMLGTPVRVSNTSFTVTGDYTTLINKKMVIKWTESATLKWAMVSTSSYGAPNTTVNIVGDTMTSIDASSLKYAIVEATVINFAVAGTIGATGTDVSNAFTADEAYKVFGSDINVHTAGTTNNTTADINKNGTTMFTTKPTLATTVRYSTTPFTADNGTSLALGDEVTVDVDAIQTTAAIDLYIKLYVFPNRYQYLA